MKIKLSKSQWEMVGRKTGWMKKAQYEPRSYFLGYQDMSGFFAISNYNEIDGIQSIERASDGKHWEGEEHPLFFNSLEEAKSYANKIMSSANHGYENLRAEVYIDSGEEIVMAC